ncbi:MAG: hypothetical protein ACI4Q8_00445 [Ruminococcus sp.]
MYLSELYYAVKSIKDTAVIGREFSAYGREYALVGLLNTDDTTELVLLEYDENRENAEYSEDFENLTNRQIALIEKDIHKDLTDLLSDVVICGKSFSTVSVRGSVLEGTMDNDTYALAEFIRQGWKSEKFFDYPPEDVFVYFVELEESIENLSQLDLSQKIKLLAYETEKTDFPQMKLKLDVEKNLEKTVSLFEGEDTICIKRVRLIDLSKEKNIDKQHLSKLCPKGMRIPVIEYTCNNDELCLDIRLTSHLDSLYNNFNSFDTEDGIIGIGIGVVLMDDSKDTKTFTIQQPVSTDTKCIDCEIVSCSKEIKNPSIEDFLI